MDKPSVYIETSIVSYLAAHPSRDPVTLRNQQLTHEWWTTQRERYALWTSRFVLDEADRGDPVMAAQRGALLAPIGLLASRSSVAGLAKALRVHVPLPPAAKDNAAHIAISAVNGIDYLLTWDCRHIANPRLLPRFSRICESWGYATPVMCTPAQLLRSE